MRDEGRPAILTIEQLWKLEAEQVGREYGKDPDPDLWRWSPLDIPEFARMLKVAQRLAAESSIRLREPGQGTHRLKLAEAGSGIGTKGYFAKHYFDLDFTGYEINDEYIARSADLGVNTIKCDLRESPGPPWTMYDIVYVARPFKDDGEEARWELAVMQAMRPGAVLISAFAAVKPYSWECHYRSAFRGVWVKPYSAPVYTDMIRRTDDGPDPLVPQPGPRRPLLPGMFPDDTEEKQWHWKQASRASRAADNTSQSMDSPIPRAAVTSV